MVTSVLSTVACLLIAAIANGRRLLYPLAEAQPPDDLEVLPVEHIPEYVVGFPMHVVITVRAHPEAAFYGQPFADFLQLRSSIGVEIAAQDARQAVRIIPEPMIDADHGRKGSPLASGESRRMLVDVSHLLAGAIGEGLYGIQFFYVDTDGPHPAAPVTLKFRKPTSAETAMLAGNAPDRGSFEDWGMWTVSCPNGGLQRSPISADNPLRFNLLFRSLICGREALDQIDPAILDVLTGLYAPERDALKLVRDPGSR